MKTEILNSITQMGRDEWNSIVGPNRLICRHEYLEAIEKSEINDCRYFYPVIRDDSGRLLAHTCLYFISTELDLFATGGLKWGIQQIRKVWPDFLILRSVECGTPVALGNTISYANGDAAILLPELVRATERVADNLGVNVILFRDFYDGETARYNQFAEWGYKRIHNLPTTRMSIRWSSFEAYLESMRSQYRYRIRRRQKAFREAGGDIVVSHSFGEHAEDLARLWMNTFDQATEYKREVLTPAYFRELDRLLGDDCFLIMATLKREPVGFCLMLHDGPLLSWVFSGLDYSCNRESFAYFNMIYAVVEYAIAHGYDAVDLGITTLVPKMDAGGVVTTQYMYMKHMKSPLGKFTPMVFDWMTPQPKATKRNVFKENVPCQNCC
jgi:predicted N-acyltransferase